MAATPDALKTVATPRDDYDAMRVSWEKCRAVCGSEEEVKRHDVLVQDRRNFLVPFSPSMTQEQYDFLKREAELPGVSAEFKQLLTGGLLRKDPEVKLPDDAPAGAHEWITNEFGVDGTPLSAFMLSMVGEEVETSRSIIVLDYDEDTSLPFATMYPAESLINWTKDRTQLTRAILSVAELVEGSDEFHPKYVPTIHVHELDEAGLYRVRVFRQRYDEQGNVSDQNWYQDEAVSEPLFQGERMDFVPVWPGNGEIELQPPFLLTIVNKEIGLYNKVTRRNHLLLGAGTYTPYVSGVSDEEAFKKIVGAGLGSWLHLPDKDAKIDVVKTPTEALVDYDRAITNGFEEMAKLGVRMLTPETAQSGVALQLRNASQTARLGTLNTRVSTVMKQVIATMLNWRYGTEYRAEDVEFKMQDDFAQAIIGEGWMRLATEWYESGKIPRSLWLGMMKANELPGTEDYDDEKGKKEIDAETLDFRRQEQQRDRKSVV